MADQHDKDAPKGLDRRELLHCGAWSGAGVLWALRGGVAVSSVLGAADNLAFAEAHAKNLTFVQISDTHLGFNKKANPDVAATLRQTIAKIKALPTAPAFILHTGDITHTSTPQQFDDAAAILADLAPTIHYTPGEHDTQDEGAGKEFLKRFGGGTKGDGWYSFDANGTHFIALVNVVHLSATGQGSLGAEQLAWLKDDLAHLRHSTPIVVFAHMPLWAVYPQWGWGTEDAAQAMALLKPFGSVTVLNGHIHQIQQKVEGHIRFYTARSTAYPQPAPGMGAGPGPLAVPPEQLASYLGLRQLDVVRGHGELAVADQALGA